MLAAIQFQPKEKPSETLFCLIKTKQVVIAFAITTCLSYIYNAFIHRSSKPKILHSRRFFAYGR
jgi:hypothetical protein